MHSEFKPGSGDAQLLAEADHPSPESLAAANSLFAFNDLDSPPIRTLHAWVTDRLNQLAAEGISSGLRFATPDSVPAPTAEDFEDLPAVSLDKLVNWQVQLASFPDIFIRIFEAVNRIGSNADHVADVIRMDTSLSAKLLKLVNSPLFGLVKPVDSISRAVTLAGMDELSMLALGVSAVEYFKGIPEEYMDMRSFWMHSLACGIAARCLAAHLKIFRRERYFIAGLLHDIGRLVIFRNHPKGAALVIALARTTPCPLYEAEQRVLGYNHADVAKELLSAWRIPESLEDMIDNLHHPHNAEHRQDAAIIHVADILAATLSTEMPTPFQVPPLSQEAWDMVGLPLEEVDTILEEIITILSELTSTFLR